MNPPAAQPLPSLLPRDGAAYYFGRVLDAECAARIFEELQGGDFWRNDEVLMFGRRLVLSRKMAWFGDVPYKYSGALKAPLPWSRQLLELKMAVEAACGYSFNSCLLNYYADGSEGMGWHSDDEKSLVSNAAIASLSLGAERNFRFKHRRAGETVSVLLETGSLLLMGGKRKPIGCTASPRANGSWSRALI